MLSIKSHVKILYSQAGGQSTLLSVKTMSSPKAKYLPGDWFGNIAGTFWGLV